MAKKKTSPKLAQRERRLKKTRESIDSRADRLRAKMDTTLMTDEDQDRLALAVAEQTVAIGDEKKAQEEHQRLTQIRKEKDASVRRILVQVFDLDEDEDPNQGKLDFAGENGTSAKPAAPASKPDAQNGLPKKVPAKLAKASIDVVAFLQEGQRKALAAAGMKTVGACLEKMADPAWSEPIKGLGLKRAADVERKLASWIDQQLK